MYKNGIMVTYGRDVQVNVDIRATRERFTRLKDKPLEDDEKSIIGLNCTTGFGERG